MKFKGIVPLVMLLMVPNLVQAQTANIQSPQRLNLVVACVELPQEETTPFMAFGFYGIDPLDYSIILVGLDDAPVRPVRVIYRDRVEQFLFIRLDSESVLNSKKMKVRIGTTDWEFTLDVLNEAYLEITNTTECEK